MKNNLVFPVLLIIGNQRVGKYLDMQSLTQLRKPTDFLLNYPHMPWIIVASNGILVTWQEVGARPSTSWLKRIFGIWEVFPLTVKCIEGDLVLAASLVTQAITEAFGADVDFFEAPMQHLLSTIASANSFQELVAAVPLNLPPG